MDVVGDDVDDADSGWDDVVSVCDSVWSELSFMVDVGVSGIDLSCDACMTSLRLRRCELTSFLRYGEIPLIVVLTHTRQRYKGKRCYANKRANERTSECEGNWHKRWCCCMNSGMYKTRIKGKNSMTSLCAVDVVFNHWLFKDEILGDESHVYKVE